MNHIPATAVRLTVLLVLCCTSLCGVARASSGGIGPGGPISRIARSSRRDPQSGRYEAGAARLGKSVYRRAKCASRSRGGGRARKKLVRGRCATKGAHKHERTSSARTSPRRPSLRSRTSSGASAVKRLREPSAAGGSRAETALTGAADTEAQGSLITPPEEDLEQEDLERGAPGEVPGSDGSRSESSSEPTSSNGLSTPFRFFSASSFWNVPLGGGVVLDSSSAEVVGGFVGLVASEQRAGSGPWIATSNYSVPIYTVGAGQPTVPVRLEHAPDAALSAAWSAVPLPSNAEPAAGTDGSLVVWQPSTDRLWEFWRAVHGGEGWSASWGGAMQDVSSNMGVYGPGAWPGAKPWWGVSASSLSLAGGLITFEDLERGRIEHALAMAVPGVRGGVYASPAQRSDGKSSNPLALPEGAHLRLNPNLDLAALHLPRLTLMIAEAAQRYGIFVRDGSGNVQFFAQDPKSLASNPYTGPHGYFEGQYPTQLLATFPWNELQLLKMELHPAKS